MPPSLSIFSEDKKDFYEKSWEKSQNDRIADIKNRVKTKEHSFFLDNLTELQLEFNTLQPDLNKESLYYTYYYALLLKRYHRNYSGSENHATVQEYKKIAEEIHNRIQGKPTSITTEKISYLKCFIDFINQIGCDFKNNISRISKYRDNISLLNMCRMMYMVARLTWLNLAVLIQDMQVIKRLPAFFVNDLSLEALLTKLNYLQKTTNLLSVGIFGVKFLYNIVLNGKHWLNPNEWEKEATHWKRLKFELAKRWGAYFNDIVWIAINFITNYPYAGLAFTSIIGVTVVFMLVDLALILVQWQLEKNKYEAKKEQFALQQNYIASQITALSLKEGPDNYGKLESLIAFNDMLTQQQSLHDVNYRAMMAKWQMNAAAATLLAGSFAAAFLVSPPIAVVACLFLAAVAVSLYMSAANYSDMVKKKGLYQHLQVYGDITQVIEAKKAYQKAQWTLCFNMVKYAVVPTLVLGAMIISWQVSLLVGIGFGLVWLVFKLSQKRDKQLVKQQTEDVEEFETHPQIAANNPDLNDKNLSEEENSFAFRAS